MSHTAPPTAPDHIPGLDGLRGVAVLLVMAWHFWLDNAWIASFIQLGRLGVFLFFALSGFLLGGILLQARAACEAGASSIGREAYRFFARRILRTFPIYYLTIGVLALAGHPEIRPDLLWFLTYSMNMNSAFGGKAYLLSGHIWSLCVEEQVYLLLPFLFLFSRRGVSFAAVLALLFAILALRGYVTLSGLPTITIALTVVAGGLAILAGALLAYRPQTNTRLLFAASILMLAYCGVLRADMKSDSVARMLYWLLSDIAMTALAVALIGLILQSRQVAKILSVPVIDYLGRISYGLYLYHYFLVAPLRELTSGNGMLMFLYGVTISIGIAAISYRLIEQPILRLKRRI